MDQAAAKAVFAAAVAAKHAVGVTEALSLWCYPLMPPNGKTQLTGGSLGLPVSLGFMALLKGKNLSDSVVATGTIDENGNINAVNGLHEKAACAGYGHGWRRKTFAALLYPAKCNRFETDNRLDLLPVSSLEKPGCSIDSMPQANPGISCFFPRC